MRPSVSLQSRTSFGGRYVWSTEEEAAPENVESLAVEGLSYPFAPSALAS